MADIYAFPMGTDKGLTMRDYFASAALMGMLQGGSIPSSAMQHNYPSGAPNFTDAAYHIADAMMVSRLVVHPQ